MAYVSIDAPLPRNSNDPPTACELAYDAAVVASVEHSVATAKQASGMIATPDSFAPLGDGVVRDAARSQQQLIAGNTITTPPKAPSGAEALRTAPRQHPLNVTDEAYECRTRLVTAPARARINPSTARPNMPPAAPTDTGLLTSFGPAPAAASAAPVFSAVSPQTAAVPLSPLLNPRGLGVVWGDATAYRPAPSAKPSGRAGLLLLGFGALILLATSKGRR